MAGWLADILIFIVFFSPEGVGASLLKDALRDAVLSFKIGRGASDVGGGGGILPVVSSFSDGFAISPDMMLACTWRLHFELSLSLSKRWMRGHRLLQLQTPGAHARSDQE